MEMQKRWITDDFFYTTNWKNSCDYVPSNYYPISSSILFQNNQDQEVSVLVDRSIGGSVIRDGEI